MNKRILFSSGRLTKIFETTTGKNIKFKTVLEINYDKNKMQNIISNPHPI